MEHDNWKVKENKLTRDFEFQDFKHMLAAVNKIGDLAEKMNHHPDLFIYDYQKLRISLTTHDKGNITDKDYTLAKEIDTLFL